MKYRGTIGELQPTLQKRNAQGMGVFYSVNESDGHGVKTANIKAVRVVQLDLDETAPPDVWAIEPHMLMQSSPGAPSSDILDQIVARLRTSADTATKRMAFKFGGDPNVTDRAEVFRMPGFLHQKAKPFLSRIVDIDHFKRRYSLAELDALLPPLPRLLIDPERQRHPHH